MELHYSCFECGTRRWVRVETRKNVIVRIFWQNKFVKCCGCGAENDVWEHTPPIRHLVKYQLFKEMTELKIAACVLLGYLANYLTNFITPIIPFLVIILVLVFADLYTGIKAAKKRGDYVSKKASLGLRNTVTKVSQYFTAILLAQGMLAAFEIPTAYLPLTYIVALYISIVELKSNYENISETTDIELWAFVKVHVFKILKIKMAESEKAKEEENSESETAEEEEKLEEK